MTLSVDSLCPQDYINRLDNFDGPAVADKAIEKGLFEEAFEIFKKFSKKVDAIKVGQRVQALSGLGCHTWWI